jgi:hypothetical protein
MRFFMGVRKLQEEIPLSGKGCGEVTHADLPMGSSAEFTKIRNERKVQYGIGENTLKVREEIPLGFGGR